MVEEKRCEWADWSLGAQEAGPETKKISRGEELRCGGPGLAQSVAIRLGASQSSQLKSRTAEGARDILAEAEMGLTSLTRLPSHDGPLKRIIMDMDTSPFVSRDFLIMRPCLPRRSQNELTVVFYIGMDMPCYYTNSHVVWLRY